ncbi:hypothetical protein NMY22_g710 [Coprinellus aureogranulatus]|nr:hypothetical protein NMY22_g710 [Coprinellus aureogranulatus]
MAPSRHPKPAPNDMLSNPPPAVLIIGSGSATDMALLRQLTSCSIQVAFATPSTTTQKSTYPGCANITLRWDDPTTFSNAFDTPFNVQYAAFILPEEFDRRTFGYIQSFIDLAHAEGVKEFIVISGKERVEGDMSAYLHSKGARYTSLRKGSLGDDEFARAVLRVVGKESYVGRDRLAIRKPGHVDALKTAEAAGGIAQYSNSGRDPFVQDTSEGMAERKSRQTEDREIEHEELAASIPDKRKHEVLTQRGSPTFQFDVPWIRTCTMLHRMQASSLRELPSTVLKPASCEYSLFLKPLAIPVAPLQTWSCLSSDVAITPSSRPRTQISRLRKLNAIMLSQVSSPQTAFCPRSARLRWLLWVSVVPSPAYHSRRQSDGQSVLKLFIG